MSTKKAIIKLRRDTVNNYALHSSHIPLQGEVCIVDPTAVTPWSKTRKIRFKIGDGKTSWANLPFVDESCPVIIRGYYNKGNFYLDPLYTERIIQPEGTVLYLDLSSGQIYYWSGIEFLTITASAATSPTSDNETINVTQDPTDNTKYIISLIGKESALNNSVIRKHINGSTVTYTWDVIYSAEEVDAKFDELGDLAYKDSATGTVEGQSAAVSASGSVNIATYAFEDTSTAAEISRSTYTPLGTIEHTGFSGGSLGAATKSAFALNGIVASVNDSAIEGDTDFECLILSAAETSNAVTEQGEFTAAQYGTDTFNGTADASLRVTGVTYTKQTVSEGSETKTVNVTGTADVQSKDVTVQ